MKAQDWKEWGLTLGEAAIGIDRPGQARKDKIVKGLTGGVEFSSRRTRSTGSRARAVSPGKGTVEITEGTSDDSR